MSAVPLIMPPDIRSYPLPLISFNPSQPVPHIPNELRTEILKFGALMWRKQDCTNVASSSREICDEVQAYRVETLFVDVLPLGCPWARRIPNVHRRMICPHKSKFYKFFLTHPLLARRVREIYLYTSLCAIFPNQIESDSESSEVDEQAAIGLSESMKDIFPSITAITLRAGSQFYCSQLRQINLDQLVEFRTESTLNWCSAKAIHQLLALSPKLKHFTFSLDYQFILFDQDEGEPPIPKSSKPLLRLDASVGRFHDDVHYTVHPGKTFSWLRDTINAAQLHLESCIIRCHESTRELADDLLEKVIALEKHFEPLEEQRGLEGVLRHLTYE